MTPTNSTIKNRGLVVAPQFEASHAGSEVLRAGGNAADAMVTAALVQGIADPHRCGIGGFGCGTVYWRKEKEARSFGFHGRVGSRATEDQWLKALENPAPDGFGYIIKGKANDVGFQSITTPGTISGLASIHNKYGSMPWKDLVLRAAQAAEVGFHVGPGLAEFWIRPGLHGRVSTRDRLGFTKFGKKEWFDSEGETFKAGHHKKMAALAETYRILAVEGPESFYEGTIAKTLNREFKAHSAWITSDDLKNYQADEESPVESTYRGIQVLSSPLPGGGIALLQVLKLLERCPMAELNPDSSEFIDHLAKAFKVVWADRLTFHGDPRFDSKETEELLSESYLDQLESKMNSPIGGVQAPPDSPDTTQLSIVDGEGNCVSFSHSLGYGSGIFAGDLGFMLNNCMQGFDPRPGAANSIAPGKARSTAIAETILLKKGEPWLVLGSPGAARITAAIAQVIILMVDHGYTVSEAVLKPRFDAWGDNTLFLESRFPYPIIDQLKAKGWDIIHHPKPFGMVGRVYGIQREDDGRLLAGVDPGEPGAAYFA